ncbi:hypothetical protein ACFVVM_26015 [Nocardia sp. NPDC058176]|uniref:hypothetical protein n=1 Tax=Nocardia sp. NPDC058176 TaxID=3346368 RepID=UPI0036DCF5C0
MRKMRILGVTAIAAGIILSGTGFAAADDTTPPAPESGSAVLVKGIEALLTGSSAAPTTPATVAEDEPAASGSAVLLKGIEALLTGSSAAPTTPATVAEDEPAASGSAVLLKGIEALLTGSSAAPAE